MVKYLFCKLIGCMDMNFSKMWYEMYDDFMCCNYYIDFLVMVIIYVFIC